MRTDPEPEPFDLDAPSVATAMRSLASSALTTVGAWPASAGDDHATQVYLALLQLQLPSRDAVIDRGFAPQVVDRCLAALTDIGLIDARNPSLISIASPEIAIPAYAAALERQARTTRAAAPALAHIYRISRPEPGSPTDAPEMSFLSGEEALLASYADVVGQARTSLMWVTCRGPLPDRLLLDPHLRARFLTRAAVGTTRRLIAHQSFLDAEGGPDALEDLGNHGWEVRLSPKVTASIIVADATVALIDISSVEPSGAGSLVLRYPPHVAVVQGWTESDFSTAIALPRSRDLAANSLFDPRDVKILALLAAGAADSTIARQLRISQRTVERRLRGLMTTLGATTRFQAGVQASRRGIV